MMQPEEKIHRLNDLYLNALSDASDSAFLCRMLEDEDYIVRSKAFYAAEKYCDETVKEAVLEILLHGEREWQLRALSVLCRHPDESVLPSLERCLFQREKPLLIRGAALTLAETGGEKAMELFGRFLLSPFSGYLKDDFLAHCLLKLEEQTPQGKKCWAEQEKAKPALAAVSASLCRESEPNELLMVYPYPDFLSRMAEKQGIAPKEWKRVSFFPRKKGGKAKKTQPEIKE
ncbi:MAG: HEAT repeat domain-containing protein [Clostridia bacterium]